MRKVCVCVCVVIYSYMFQYSLLHLPDVDANKSMKKSMQDSNSALYPSR